MTSVLRTELDVALAAMGQYQRTKYGDPGYQERIRGVFAGVGHEMRFAQEREERIMMEHCQSWPGNTRKAIGHE